MEGRERQCVQTRVEGLPGGRWIVKRAQVIFFRLLDMVALLIRGQAVVD